MGQAQDQVFQCKRCGECVTFVGVWAPPDHPDLVSGDCSICRMRESVDNLPAAAVEAIREAARGGVLPAIREVKEKLGWPLREASLLVHVLQSQPESGARSKDRT